MPMKPEGVTDAMVKAADVAIDKFPSWMLLREVWRKQFGAGDKREIIAAVVNAVAEQSPVEHSEQ